MRHRVIPGTDLRVSRLCLGTASFGSTFDRSQSFALMDAFVGRGGNFLDTAHGYADWVRELAGCCVSEATIGAWMREPGNRDRVVVATKGGWTRPGTPELMSSREELLAQIERSRQELGVDCIDLYWIHYDNPAYPVAHFIDLLNEQAQAGAIRSFGCSNWTLPRIREANAYAAQQGVKGFIANQPWWSLAAPDLDAYGDPRVVGMDEATLAFHRETGMAVMAYSPQAKGFFSKLEERGPDGLDAFAKKMYLRPENVGRLAMVRDVAAETGASIAQVALAWILAQPFPTFPIVGCRTLEQLEESMRADDVRLVPDQIRRLEAGSLA